MSHQFRLLFSPLKVGSVTLKNRVVCGAHTTLFGTNGIMDDRYIEYQRERARGGAGMIVAGMQMIHPSSRCFTEIFFAHEERVIPQFRKLADAVHEHGAVVLAQLAHSGRGQNSSFSREPIWGPSAIPDPSSREVPMEMQQEHINAAIEGFVRSARNAQIGLLDGVELHSIGGYLIQQFLSPWSNRRTDDYGGSLDNRLRFLREIISGIRAECGRDFVIGTKMAGDELVAGGLGIAD